MNEEFRFGDTDRLKKRERQLTEFLNRMFDKEDRPTFVGDDACLYDIYAGDDNDLSARCNKWYGRTLSPSDFQLPVWQLLDVLYG